MYPKVFNRDHQSVTVHAFARARYNGQRCYRVDLSGAERLYFGEHCSLLAHAPVNSDITRHWYSPDSDFDRYAAHLDELGAWPAEDDAA